MADVDRLAAGYGALAEGRWRDARGMFEAAVAETGETAEARFGRAMALWWSGENRLCVGEFSRAHALFRRKDDVAGAVQCAVWLAIAYKGDFANFAAANGWIGRAERMLGSQEPGPLHGWIAVARAYRMTDLDEAARLSARAVELARDAADVDLELVALAHLGLVRVGKGDTEGGFALLDEAAAAALGGESPNLDTVVYACCYMLTACELASDVERAVQWCKVADHFVETYGCPFLHAECRIYYGSVLAATGLWDSAGRELETGVRITAGRCPGLHRKAMLRLAGLRVRQGRLEDAEQLLAQLGRGLAAEVEEGVWLAALLLARGDAAAARSCLEQRMDQLEGHRLLLGSALDLLVDAHLASNATGRAAGAAAQQLTALAAEAGSDRLAALASAAMGRVAAAAGDAGTAVAHLQTALREWSNLESPYEAARCQFELARVLSTDRPDGAVDHARRALSGFEALGAAPDADRVAAFLRSLGVTPRTGRKGLGTLTVREREVLRLVAAGLSNPEIADRIHVSRKTASHHVSHILTKLNLRNRAEAAVYAIAGGRDLE